MSALGFIGVGTIGGPMAQRLLEHGRALRVHDAAPEAVARLAARGAAVAANAGEIARDCEIVFLSLPGPPQIAAVMDELLANAGRLVTIVDLSTSSLDLARELAGRAAGRGIAYLDAPVSGGRMAATEGSLALMAGGEAEAFAAVRPHLECFAKHLFHLGPAGAGTLAKLVNNQIFLCASVLIQEGFVLGAKGGMSPGTLAEVLSVSSAGPLLARASLLLGRRFDQDLFALGIAAKDVGLALDSARAIGVSMPATEGAHGVYLAALERGFAREDFFATQKVLEEAAGVTLPPLTRKRP